MVRPVTVHDVAGAVAIHVPTTFPPDSFAVTIYEVIGEPPFPATVFAGAVNETTDDRSATVATGEFGALGVVAGVTGPEVVGVDEPVAFVATTENVYGVPFERTEIAQDVAGEMTVQVAPPGEAVTV